MTKLKAWKPFSVLIALVLLVALGAALIPASPLLAMAQQQACDNVPPPPPTPPPPTPAPSNPSVMTQQQVAANVYITGLCIEPGRICPGGTVTITTNASNTGGTTGYYSVVLMINGQQEATKLVSVGAMSAQPVKFTITRDVPGTYTVIIGSQQASFTVVPSTAGSPVSAPLIVAVVIGIVFIASLVVLFLRRRGFA